MRLGWHLAYLSLAVACVAESGVADNSNEQTCTWEDRATCQGNPYKDKNLKPMKISLGGVESTFEAYITPDVATFYNQTPGTVDKVESGFQGLFAKFINLSSKNVRVYWKSTDRNASPSYIADIAPFSAAGTASYPHHNFIVTEPDDISKVLHSWSIVGGTSNYAYDPYGSVEEAAKKLWKKELDLYKLQYENLEFDKLYKKFTGRDWVSLYGRQHQPRYPMWPADSFGQTHQFTTNETQFVSQPPAELANSKVSSSAPSKSDLELREKLRKYRSPEESLTLNVTVLSVAPRAYEIRNFLSQEEVTLLLEIATGTQLSRSTTRAGNTAQATTSDSTRTSQNSWLARSRSPIVDTVYRRAADLLQIDEAFFRHRSKEEQHLVPESGSSIAERIQLVHYAPGQQYTPHHDFAVPDVREGQPSRFATVLFYLNDVEEGGETSFPRWLNGEKKEILKVKPEVGKAVLFYSVLPDGNYDERSQHAALPVIKGEKWLTNLWVWDPFMW